MVRAEAGLERGHVVVTALHQRLARHVVVARHLGRVEGAVVRAAAGLVREPALDALHQDRVVHGKLHRRVQLGALARQQRVQLGKCWWIGCFYKKKKAIPTNLLGLADGAGEAVEEKAVRALGRVDVVLDEANDNVVAHQLAWAVGC